MLSTASIAKPSMLGLAPPTQKQWRAVVPTTTQNLTLSGRAVLTPATAERYAEWRACRLLILMTCAQDMACSQWQKHTIRCCAVVDVLSDASSLPANDLCHLYITPLAQEGVLQGGEARGVRGKHWHNIQSKEVTHLTMPVAYREPDVQQVQQCTQIQHRLPMADLLMLPPLICSGSSVMDPAPFTKAAVCRVLCPLLHC